MDDKSIILENIKECAREHSYGLTPFAERIAAAKLRFFGVENWRNCPCVRDGLHSWISDVCKGDIEHDGVCHCNLYKKAANP